MRHAARCRQITAAPTFSLKIHVGEARAQLAECQVSKVAMKGQLVQILLSLAVVVVVGMGLGVCGCLCV